MCSCSMTRQMPVCDRNPHILHKHLHLSLSLPGIDADAAEEIDGVRSRIQEFPHPEADQLFAMEHSLQVTGVGSDSARTVQLYVRQQEHRFGIALAVGFQCLE